MIKNSVKLLEQKSKHTTVGLQRNKKLFSCLEIREVFTKERILEQRID